MAPDLAVEQMVPRSHDCIARANINYVVGIFTVEQLVELHCSFTGVNVGQAMVGDLAGLDQREPIALQANFWPCNIDVQWYAPFC